MSKVDLNNFIGVFKIEKEFNINDYRLRSIPTDQYHKVYSKIHDFGKVYYIFSTMTGGGEYFIVIGDDEFDIFIKHIYKLTEDDLIIKDIIE